MQAARLWTNNVKLAQKFLGHSYNNTTAYVYVCTTRESEQAAANSLEEAIVGDLFQIVRDLKKKNSSGAVN